MNGLYMGEISPNVANLDLADISVLDFLKSLDISLIDDKEKELVNRLISAIEESNSDIRFNDDRYVHIATKLTRHVHIENADFSYFLLANRNLIAFYDQRIPQIDNLIAFMSMFIGYSVSKEVMSAEDHLKYNDLASNVLSSSSQELMSMLPKYVKQALEKSDQMGVGESIDVKGVNKIKKTKPIVESQPKELSADEMEWQETINVLTDLIASNSGSKEDIEEWRETITILQGLLNPSPNQMKRGGKINVKRLAMKRLSQS